MLHSTLRKLAGILVALSAPLVLAGGCGAQSARDARPAGASEPPRATVQREASGAKGQAGRAGLYYRVSRRDRERNYDHPLVDAVVLTSSWAEVEPRRGEFRFDELSRSVKRWGQAGKGVVVNVALYGQSATESLTPDWVFAAGVEGIAFQGGGRGRGSTIRVPKVWEEAFAGELLAPLVQALGREFDGHPHVWFVMPAFGHLGNINAQPSREGATALRRAGWTPEVWARYVSRVAALYQTHFKKTPLLAKSTPMLLRDRRADHYAAEADAIVARLGRSGVSVISLGISGELRDARRIHSRLEPLVPLAKSGGIRLGTGDDWPLWVPPQRRQGGPNQGYDEANLERVAELAFGGVEGLPETPITLLFCQEPEVSASNPELPEHDPNVHRIMKAFRERLQANEARIRRSAE